MKLLTRFSLFVIFITSISESVPLETIQSKLFYDTSVIHFNLPIWFGELPNKTGSFLVGQLNGQIFRLDNTGPNRYTSSLFAELEVGFMAGNDGLLGLAFHPDFKNNHKYYVYSISVPGESILEERFADHLFQKDSGVSRILLKQTFKANVHNGGDIHFGPDGYLYLGLGDAGNPKIFNSRSQDLHLLAGKMLRINVNTKDSGLEYSIPTDNPYSHSQDPLVRPEIFASGLRNPWRWNFDPQNGQLIVGDVGDWVQEEIDLVVKGKNYGWSKMEGTTCFNGTDELTPLATCDSTGLTMPLATMTHSPISTTTHSSITGGFVFRGDKLSPFFGVYIFGDFMQRKIYGLLPTDNGFGEIQLLGTSPSAMSSFGTDSAGNIYSLGYENGIIYKLANSGLIGKGVSIHSKKNKTYSDSNIQQKLILNHLSSPAFEFNDSRIYSTDGKWIHK